MHCREGSPPRPTTQCENNPYTVFVLTAHGGHCAHLPLGSWVTGKAWMDTVAMQFCSAVTQQAPSSSTADPLIRTVEVWPTPDPNESQGLLRGEYDR